MKKKKIEIYILLFNVIWFSPGAGGGLFSLYSDSKQIIIYSFFNRSAICCESGMMAYIFICVFLSEFFFL